ncbi:MAG: DUF2190 family protein [Phycisphaeraceae bacterium]
MILRYLHDGDAIDFTPAEDKPAGSVVVLGDLVGITKRPLKAGELGSLHVVGVFAFPKATGADTAIDAGVSVYWDAGAEQATTESSGNTLLGKTSAAAGDDDATVPVRLNP